MWPTIRAIASPRSGLGPPWYWPLAKFGSARMALRPTASNAMLCALRRAVVAIGMAATTLSGYRTAHSSTCMPPMEPPSTARSLRMPRCSTRRFWTLTMSSIVMIGKSRPQGRPVAGLIEDGPVVPLQPPSTFEQITKYRLVSMPFRGPTMMSHQPGLRSCSEW